ncbi:hypothetical protein CIY_28960 [Butyrivibrio fibrisolvens 16/4]|nr:hypothetical protein CIY_28960 [Butyrivibrio fibrisolvens 16/4]
MNYYFLKIILKNKYTKLLILVVSFLCVIVTLQLRETVHYYDADDYIFQYKSEIISTRIEIMRERYFLKQNNPGMGTVEGNVNWISYLMWCLKIDKAFVNELEKEGTVTEEFLEEQRRYRIIQSLCEIQANISVPNGDIPLDEACVEDLEKYGDYLKLDELPFDFNKLAYCGQGGYDSALSEANQNFILQAKVVFDSIDNGLIDYNMASPYTFLSMLFGDFNLTDIIIPISLLYFAIEVVMSWKEEYSYRIKTSINCSDVSFFQNMLVPLP